jgi:hypothetical protein
MILSERMIWQSMIHENHNLNTIKQLMMVSFQRKRLQFKNFDDIQFLIKKLIVHSLNAPHKQGIPTKSKKNYAHVIHGHGLTKCSQVLCNVMILTTPQTLTMTITLWPVSWHYSTMSWTFGGPWTTFSWCIHNACKMLFSGDRIQSQFDNYVT